MKKKILLNLLVVFLSLFLLNTFGLKAEGELVTNLEGVSIRKKTDDYSQGLRFYGKLDESVKGNAHGFYLVYGKTTLSELTEKLDSGANPIYINGKEVYHIEIPGSTEENNFSVVLVGIPEDGYFDLISVIPYVVVNGVKVFPPEVNKRCVADVALKMANAGEEVADIVRFDSIVNTNKKKVSMSPNGDVIISSGVYELNILKLRREFIKDWNYTFNKTLTELNHEEFFNEAKEGSPDTDVNNNDLSNTNLYKFFNNHRFSNKWRWLLNYMVNECDIYFASLQANAILGNGLGNNLFNGAHLAYSLVNFFNQSNEKGLYNAIDFTDLSRYDRVKNYNDGVYVDMREYELYDEGGEFNLPAPLNKPGYNFKHYKKGGVEYNPNAYYQVTNNEEKFEAIYSPIEYPLSFYDGAMKINELNRTYNVEDEISLPVYEKAGYNFVGWYDNSNLFGSPITNIEKGRTGALNLYGKWSEEIIEYVYNINYELNGGHFPGAYPTQYSMNEETLLPVPVRSGYQFAGWYNNSELTGDAITKITIGSVFDKTFYAKWTAIGQTDAEKLNDAKTALNIGLQSGDTLASITGNVTLPTTGMHDAVITWATSNSGAITTAGVVTRGASDEIVTLTATIKINSLSDTKVFNLTVKEATVSDADKALDAKNALEITYASGDSATSVTQNVTLPTTGMHSAVITWATSNSGAITTAGAVTRSTANDVTVTLTATIKVNLEQETKTFTLLVKKLEPEPTSYTITFNLNGGQFVTSGYANKSQLATAFLTDLYAFVNPSENLTTFMHGAGKTSGFDGLWFSNETYRGKIYGANIKTGNNNYFLSHSNYQAKWAPLANFMVNFVKKGNPDQDFWSSPYTGCLRMKQYFTNVKPGPAWSDEDMAAMPTGLSATQIPNEYNADSPAITLPTATRSGYEFKGWYETANFSGTPVTSIPAGSSGNKVYYAKWDQPSSFTITYNLNGGAFAGYTNKATLARDFLTDLYNFVSPSENLTAFMHGVGKTSGFDGLWYSNEEYRAKIYAANTKSGNNNYFLSHSTYGPKWKPFANFMVNFVKVGNPDQDFWASTYTGNLRMKQYFTNVKPGSAWSDADMAALPTGLSASVYYEYSVNSPTITLPTPTRSGYTFDGWYTAATGGTKVTSIPQGSTGNKTFYARWSIVDISINRTRTLTGTDLWNMRDSVNNVSLVSGSIRLTNTGATGAINTRPMTITTFYQLVMSWNVSNLGNAEVQFMVSIGTGSSMSKWFTMGYWKTGNHRSSSATSDTFASLSVDTLTNKNVSGNTKVKFRIVITPNGSAPRIDSVSVTTKPTSSTGVSASTSGLAYKVLNVPRIAQMSIPNIGSVICSPTSMAMILNYYGKGVTAAGVAGVVYDRTWKAYGNWTLNASYAGHFGLYSRVEFVSSMSVIRDYINRGIPVAVSVNCSYKIAGNPGSPQAYPSGHLLVVVGFESINGVWHAVVNDPAVSSADNVRRKYTVASLSSAMVGFTYIVSSSPL